MDERSKSRAQWSAAADAWTRLADDFEKINGVSTRLLLDAARLGPDLKGLDLASGPGDPALSIAQIVGPKGRVTATDQSEEMVAGAMGRASRRGIKNFDAKVADAESLPFPDDSFDRVTSRFGAMLFVDPVKGLSEARRVLKLGGRAAILVWGPRERNMMFTLVPRELGKIIELPPPDPEAPSAVRLGPAGALVSVLQKAAFRDIEETRKAIPLNWGRGAADAWGMMKRLMASLPPVLAGLPEDKRRRFNEAMIAALEGFTENGEVVLPAEVVCATGEK